MKTPFISLKKISLQILIPASLMVVGCSSGFQGASTGGSGGVSEGTSGIPEIPDVPNIPDPNATYEVYSGCEKPSESYTRTIYADPVNGLDTGDGSQAKPFKTLGAAFAAKKILAGDHVIAMPGDHGTLYSSKYNNGALENSTKWIWVEGKEGAKFTSLDIRDMSRWLITNIEVSKETGTLASFAAGSNIVLADSDFYTTKNTSTWAATDWINKAASAISTRNTKCAAILRNKVLNVRFGISISADAVAVVDNQMNVLIANNSIKNYSGDGIRPNSSNINIRDNSIIDSYASAADGDGNHDDAIQGFALNGTIFDNVVIDRTYIQETTNPSRAFNASLQGISVFDGVFTNMKIRNNVIIISAYHGIAVFGPKNLVIENNTVAGILPNVKTWITVPTGKNGQLPENIVVRNNIAKQFSLPANATTNTNNIVVLDPVSAFVKFDLSNALFDLHPLSGSIIDGKGAGAY